MSDAAGVAGSERRLLRRIAMYPFVPSFVREQVLRLEASNLGYRLAHGAFWSLAGTALSRVLALAASVVTARILGKADYGAFGVLSSTVMTFQAFATLGLSMTATKYVAELRAKDKKRTSDILALSAAVSTAAGLLSAGSLWVFAPWLAAQTLGAPELAKPLQVAGVALFFTTMGSAQQGALAGFEAFRSLTRLNVWSALLGVPASVAGVWLWGLDGAVWAMVATSALQWVLTHFAVRARAAEDGLVLRLSGWWNERRVLWTFSLPALAQGVMVSPVTWAATAILVNQPRGYLEMGAFNAASQWYGAVLFLPGALGGALLPVLSERIGQADRAGARAVLRAAVALNAAVVVPIVVAGTLAGPWIMGLYGPEFAGAWPTFAVVLATAGVVAVLNPVGTILAASGRLWLGFFMNSGWAVVFLGATLLLVERGAFGLATARLIAYVVHALWTVGFALKFVRA